MSSPGGNKKLSAMNPADAARIQGAAAQAHGGEVERGSFASRAQSEADRAAAAQEKVHKEKGHHGQEEHHQPKQ